jgi:chorismate dehydratase
LNARPLIWGLENDPDIELDLEVPANLLSLLREENCDVALLPTIDYQRLDGLCIMPSGAIGCDGPTLTVRIFARQPIQSIRTLACDSESHTSVALARIILAERYHLRPEFIDLKRATDRQDEARLLIGDKVVCEEPRGCPHQYDLGEEWNALTGLPFVFAVWTARRGNDLGDLPQRLERARQEGSQHLQEIIQQHATPRGWPADLAERYLTENLKFHVGPRQIRAIETFHHLAMKHGVIERLIPLHAY